MSNQPFQLTPLVKKPCAECPLRTGQLVTQQVPTEVWGEEIDVLFIAEAPGATEDREGRPVVGQSGRILRRTVRQLNEGTEERVAYGNVVRCRPTEGNKNRTPTRMEIKICRKNILRDIERIKPKYIVICGAIAAKGVALQKSGTPFDPREKMSTLRGTDCIVQTPDGTIIPATITYHFAYILRQPTATPVFRDDIAKAFMRARGLVKDYTPRGRPAIVLDTVAKVRKYLGYLVKGLTKDHIVGWDYETDSLRRVGNRLLTIGFAHHGNQGVVIPYRHPEAPWLAEEFAEIKQLLTRFFGLSNPSFGQLVAHNLKFECAITLDEFGLYPQLPMNDTQLRAHMLNEARLKNTKGGLKLKTLAPEWLGFHHYDDEDIKPVVDLVGQGEAVKAPLAELAEYNAMDCYVTHRLFDFERRWAEHDGYEAFETISKEFYGTVSPMFAQMERNGIRADIDKFRYHLNYHGPLISRMRELLVILYKSPNCQEANHRLLAKEAKTEDMKGALWGNKQRDNSTWIFDISKTHHKQLLFIEIMGLQAVSFTEKLKHPRIDQAFIAKHQKIREVSLFNEWSALQKLVSTYIRGPYDKLTENPDMEDGRMRTTYHVGGTRTGRIASSDPNMLNIPKKKNRTESAQIIKQLYATDPGHVMIIADYSQAEVRWLAQYSEDPFLIKSFTEAYYVAQECWKNPTPEMLLRAKTEGDFHTLNAAKINNKRPQDVIKEERDQAKAVVFGIIYGQGPGGLARNLGITVVAAKDYIASFFSTFTKVESFLNSLVEEGISQGRVFSPIGRRKTISTALLLGKEHVPSYYDDEVPEEDRDPRGSFSAYEGRTSRNAPIQGVASDMNLMACVAIQKYIVKYGKKWRLINTVYDSIMAEVPFTEVAEYYQVAKGIMEDPALMQPLGVRAKLPFASDFSLGVNWSDQLDIEPGETWEISCNVCSKKRTEPQLPTDRRCEECGSQNVGRRIVKGPLLQLLHQLDRDYRLSAQD